jgi:hypothetical protein
MRTSAPRWESKAKRRAELAFENLKLAASAVVIVAKADVRLKTQYEKD